MTTTMICSKTIQIPYQNSVTRNKKNNSTKIPMLNL